MTRHGRYASATLDGPAPASADPEGAVIAAHAIERYAGLAWDGRSESTWWTAITQATASTSVDGVAAWMAYTAADAPPTSAPPFRSLGRAWPGRWHLPTHTFDGDLAAHWFEGADDGWIALFLAKHERTELARTVANGRTTVWSWLTPVGREGAPLPPPPRWQPFDVAQWRALGGGWPFVWQ